MRVSNPGHQIRRWRRMASSMGVLAILIAVAFILLGNVSLAAEKPTKYQVVTGSDEKAYLVDTTTGFVWILTYRTMAAGREPVAIPYKFIKISPKNQREFLVESAQDTSLPSCKTQ